MPSRIPITALAGPCQSDAKQGRSLAPTLQRGSVVGPLQRPVSSKRTSPPARRDAGASPIAPTPERGSQKRKRRATFGELIDAGVLDVTDGYRAKNSELGGTGLIFLRAGHVTDTHIDFARVDRFRDKLTPRLKETLSKTGDVVVTTKGNSTGRTTFVAPTMGARQSDPGAGHRPQRPKRPALRYLCRCSRAAAAGPGAGGEPRAPAGPAGPCRGWRGVYDHPEVRRRSGLNLHADQRRGAGA